MGYRDDHEAALARVAALEDELARERADDAGREAHVGTLQAELTAARTELARAEDELAKLRRPPPKDEARPPRIPAPIRPLLDPARLVGIAAVLLIVGGVIYAIASKPRARRAEVAAQRPGQIAEPDDLSRDLAEARERVQDQLRGARLVEIKATGVDAQGRLDASYGRIKFDFERTNLPPIELDLSRLPLGAPRPAPPAYDPLECRWVVRSPAGWEEIDDNNVCHYRNASGARVALEPRCTMRAVWAMAIADGAAPEAIATITLDGDWSFQIDDPRAPFTRTYADLCVPPSTDATPPTP